MPGTLSEFEPPFDQGDQQSWLPQIDLTALGAGLADAEEAAELAQAAALRAAELGAAVPIEELIERNERADENRRQLDEIITTMTTPLVELFGREFERHEKKTPRHPGTLADIPPLDEDPHAWHEYIKKHCYRADWPSAMSPGSEYFAAGLPDLGSMMLVGFGVRTPLSSGNRDTWMQVHSGRVVVAAEQFRDGFKAFVTGTASDHGKPPKHISRSGHRAEPSVATYDAGTDSYTGSLSCNDHTLALGALGNMCDSLFPSSPFRQMVTKFNRYKREHPQS